MVYSVPRDKGIIPKDKVKISVIVPCYNAEKYLRRCIQSILSQTIGISHMELILVDDASTDGTREILESYEKQHPEQFLVVNCEQNGKQGRARNIGMQYATGDYITFVDADDEIVSCMLEELLAGALKWNAEVSECGQNEVVPGEDEKAFARERTAQLFQIESEEERRAFFLSNAWACGPVRRLYRSSFLFRNRIFFLENIYMEDMYFTYLVLTHALSWYRISDPYYRYYQNPDSVMHSERKKEYYMDVHYVFSRTVNELKRRGILPGIERELEYVYFHKVLCDLSSFILNHFDNPNESGIGEIRDYIKQVFPDMKNNSYITGNDRKIFDMLMSRT